MDERSGSGSRWKTFAKLSLIVLIVTGLLVLIPFAFENAFGATENLQWVGLIGLLLGVLSFYVGFKMYRERQLIRDTPTSKVRSLAIGSAEIQGQAHPVGDPLTSPLTQTPCCVYEFKVEERRPKRRTTRDSSGRRKTKTKWEWETVVSLRDHVPFYVDDGTGRVPVHPEGGELDMKLEERLKLGENDPPPDELGRWADEHDPFDGLDFLPGSMGDMVQKIQASGRSPEDIDITELYPEGFDQADPDAMEPDDVQMAAIIYDKETQEPADALTEKGPSGQTSLFGKVKGFVSTGVDLVEASSKASGQEKYMKRSTSYKRRIEEKVLAAGESAYIFGAAHRLDEADSIENVRNLIVQKDPHTGKFLISDKSITELLDEQLVDTSAFLGAAVVLLAYSSLVLLRYAGLV